MSLKTALITGANRGIGFEVASQLGERGFHVVLSGRDENKVKSAFETLRNRGISAESLVMDVSDSKSVRKAFQNLSKSISGLDVLINNAAVLLDQDTSLLRVEEKDFTDTFQTNVFGPFFVVRQFLPLMKEGSRIINVSSGGGQVLKEVSTWAPVYCITKATLNFMTRQWAVALADRGVSINAVDPGWVKTDMGGMAAPRPVSAGAETIVWLADEADAGMTGRFYKDKKEVHW